MKTAQIFEKFTKGIKRHHLLDPGDRVIVAVSGGADSIALLHLLLSVQRQYRLDLIVAHLNHSLRGEESDEDEEFVRQLAAECQLRFLSEKLPEREKAECGGNLEQWARNRRYEFLLRCALAESAQKVALGHTMNDQAETLLMRLIRGSGTVGLAAIPPQRNQHFVRPMLYLEREEIEWYLTSRQSVWRRDSSNQDIRFLRNRLRHELLVQMKASYNPKIIKTISNAAEILREDAEALQFCATSLFDSKAQFDGRRVVLDVPCLLSYPVGLQKNLIRHSLLRLTAHATPPSFNEIVSIMELLQDGKSGKTVETGAVRCQRHFQKIILEQKEFAQQSDTYRYVLGIPGEVEIAQTGTFFLASLDGATTGGEILNQWEFFLEPDELRDGFLIRNWEPGDVYWLRGHDRPRKVAQILSRRKIPKRLRSLWPIVTLRDKIICLKDFDGLTDKALKGTEDGRVRVIVEERKR